MQYCKLEITSLHIAPELNQFYGTFLENLPYFEIVGESISKW